MRLYLNADSKNQIGYTPDTLIIELGNERKEYDIQGWTDFDMEGLHTRTKGQLLKKVEDDFEEMNENDDRELANMLINPNVVVIVAVYPANSDDEQVKSKVDTDVLENGEGSLCLNNFPEDINFRFHTEFYGL